MHKDQRKQMAMLDAVQNLLIGIGEDPERDGLRDTPARVVKALAEMTEGYQQDPKTILSKQFDNDGKYDQMIILTDIDFVSLCEHHMLPFYGKAGVAYVPGNNKIVGLSKLARLVECFARRLQVQERMTQQIADALDAELQPIGVGVIIKAHHSCMSCRGIKKAGASMITSSLKGVLKEDLSARQEFLKLVGDL